MIAQVREKRSQLRQKIMQGRTSELDSDLGEALRRHWYPVVEVTAPEKEVVAVDGSRGIRQFASGAVFYVARALDLRKRDIQNRRRGRVPEQRKVHGHRGLRQS